MNKQIMASCLEKRLWVISFKLTKIHQESTCSGMNLYGNIHVVTKILQTEKATLHKVILADVYKLQVSISVSSK